VDRKTVRNGLQGLRNLQQGRRGRAAIADAFEVGERARPREVAPARPERGPSPEHTTGRVCRDVRTVARLPISAVPDRGSAIGTLVVGLGRPLAPARHTVREAERHVQQ